MKKLFLLALLCAVVLSLYSGLAVAGVTLPNFTNFKGLQKKQDAGPGIPKPGEDVKKYYNTGNWETPAIDDLKLPEDQKTALKKACWFIYDPSDDPNTLC